MISATKGDSETGRTATIPGARVDGKMFTSYRVPPFATQADY